MKLFVFHFRQKIHFRSENMAVFRSFKRDLVREFSQKSIIDRDLNFSEMIDLEKFKTFWGIRMSTVTSGRYRK